MRQKINKRQCTERELRFLDLLFGEANFNVSLAYKLTGFKDTNARHGGCLLRKKLLPIINSWLDEAGLDETALKCKLVSLLNARETKFFTNGGKVAETRTVDALGIQIKALELAMKAKGMLSEKSSREIEQIDELIEIELERLRLATSEGLVPAKI